MNNYKDIFNDEELSVIENALCIDAEDEVSFYLHNFLTGIAHLSPTLIIHSFNELIHNTYDNQASLKLLNIYATCVPIIIYSQDKEGLSERIKQYIKKVIIDIIEEHELSDQYFYKTTSKVENKINDLKEKGENIIALNKIELFYQYCYTRPHDLYNGEDLDAALDIIKMLNNNELFDECYKTLEKQNHSGISWSIVTNMIKQLAINGEEFYNYIQSK